MAGQGPLQSIRTWKGTRSYQLHEIDSADHSQMQPQEEAVPKLGLSEKLVLRLLFVLEPWKANADRMEEATGCHR